MLSKWHISNTFAPDKPYPLIMGILNITPDSFSDGNLFMEIPKAVEKAKQLIDDGADIIDIGGESTRPGSENIPEDEELKRVIPVLSEIRKYSDIPVSVDTRKAGVAIEAIDCGANIINDISAGCFDIIMPEVIARYDDVGYILMHMKGEPATMQDSPFYIDVINEIHEFFADRLRCLEEAGIKKNRIILDPGIGFGKNLAHNLTILHNLDKFRSFQLPLLIGASRKRFIDEISPAFPAERTAGSLAAALVAAERGVAIIRTHDVKEHRQFFRVLNSIREN